MIRQAIKKPVKIKFIQFKDNPNRISEISDFLGGCRVNYKNPDKPFIPIKTLEGVMKAQVGDYIIKGTKGEFYPCKPDIFKLTYDIIK